MTYLSAQNVQLFGYGEQMKCHGSFISAASGCRRSVCEKRGDVDLMLV